MIKWPMTAAVLLFAACSSAPETTTPTPQPAVQTPPAPVAVDPAGSYEFSTIVDGQTVTGTMAISGTPGAYRGRILSNMFPEIPITSVTVFQRKMVVKGSMPDGEVTLNMAFTGQDFVGNWELGQMTGDFTGKKLPQ